MPVETTRLRPQAGTTRMSENSSNSLNPPSLRPGEETQKPGIQTPVLHAEDLDLGHPEKGNADAVSLFAFEVNPIEPIKKMRQARIRRSEERRVGKECRSRWS